MSPDTINDYLIYFQAFIVIALVLMISVAGGSSTSNLYENNKRGKKVPLYGLYLTSSIAVGFMIIALLISLVKDIWKHQMTTMNGLSYLFLLLLIAGGMWLGVYLDRRGNKWNQQQPETVTKTTQIKRVRFAN